MAVIYRDKAGFAQMASVAYTNEGELQRILMEHPELLRAEDEPQLYCLGEEIALGDAGTADLLFLDSDGKLSVVEVKLARNEESRRDVLAQAFDYTSALADYTMDELDSQLKGVLDSQLQTLAGDGPDSRPRYNKLWESCANAMKAGSVRLVVAMDEEREDLARIVRYVDEHSDLDLRLLVVRKYGSADQTILFPEFVVHGGGSAVTRRPERGGRGPSEHKQLQLDYWTAYRQYMVNSKAPCIPPKTQDWIRHQAGWRSRSLSENPPANLV